MPHHVFHLLPAVLLLVLGGCASTNLFSGLSACNKAPADHSAQESVPEQAARTDKAAHDRAPQSKWTAEARVPDGRVIAKPSPYANRSSAELLAESELSRRAGDLIGARIACEQAIRTNPSDLEAKYQLARISDDQGRFADAERIYMGLLHEKPGDPAVLTSLGWSYYLQRRFDDSERCLREAIAQNPQSQVAWNNLGFVYGVRGDLDTAWKCFRSAGTETQAQDAMAMLTQNAGAIPASSERANFSPDRDPRWDSQSQRQTDVTIADAGAKAMSPSTQYATPQAKKLAEDLQRLKAASDKREEQRRPSQESQKMSAPSPWNDDRLAVSGTPPRDASDFAPAGETDRTVPYGYGAPSANPLRTRPSPSDSGQALTTGNEAAFSRASPAQANRSGTAETQNFGRNNYYPGTQPSENSIAPLASRSNSTAEYRIPEWPGGSAAGVPPVGVPPSGGVGPARNSSQDSQVAAALVGLSAGPGSMGIPVSDLPTTNGGQTPNGGAAPAVNIRLQPPAGGTVPPQRIWNQQSQNPPLQPNEQPAARQ